MPASKQPKVTKSQAEIAAEIAQNELNARLRDGLQARIDAAVKRKRHELRDEFEDENLDFELVATPRQRVTVTLTGQPVKSAITTPVVGDGVPLPPDFND